MKGRRWVSTAHSTEASLNPSLPGPVPSLRARSLLGRRPARGPVPRSPSPARASRASALGPARFRFQSPKGEGDALRPRWQDRWRGAGTPPKSQVFAPELKPNPPQERGSAARGGCGRGGLSGRGPMSTGRRGSSSRRWRWSSPRRRRGAAGGHRYRRPRAPEEPSLARRDRAPPVRGSAGGFSATPGAQEEKVRALGARRRGDGPSRVSVGALPARAEAVDVYDSPPGTPPPGLGGRRRRARGRVLEPRASRRDAGPDREPRAGARETQR